MVKECIFKIIAFLLFFIPISCSIQFARSQAEYLHEHNIKSYYFRHQNPFPNHIEDYYILKTIQLALYNMDKNDAEKMVNNESLRQLLFFSLFPDIKIRTIYDLFMYRVELEAINNTSIYSYYSFNSTVLNIYYESIEYVFKNRDRIQDPNSIYNNKTLHNGDSIKTKPKEKNPKNNNTVLRTLNPLVYYSPNHSKNKNCIIENNKKYSVINILNHDSSNWFYISFPNGDKKPLFAKFKAFEYEFFSDSIRIEILPQWDVLTKSLTLIKKNKAKLWIYDPLNRFEIYCYIKMNKRGNIFLGKVRCNNMFEENSSKYKCITITINKELSNNNIQKVLNDSILNLMKLYNTPVICPHPHS